MARQRTKKNRILMISGFVLLFLLLGGLVFAAMKKEQNEQERLQELKREVENEEKADELSRSIHVDINTSSEEYNKYSLKDVTIILSAKEFVENYRNYPSNDTSNAQVTCGLANAYTLSSGEIVVVSFECYAEEKAAKLSMKLNNSDVHFYCTTTPTRYNIPFFGDQSISTLGFELESEFQNVFLNGMTISVFDERAYSDSYYQLGPHLLDSYRNTTFKPEDRICDNANAVIVHDNMMYAIYAGTLSIYDISGSECRLVSTLDGLGTTRDMTFTSDKSAIIVSSRRNGAYIIDISNPDSPSVLSHYDALEYCTGLQSSGDYLFLCSRWFGIEIVDISNKSNPSFVTRISGDNEYQDCFFCNGYLYVGVYNGKRIDVWNVKTINKPELVSQIELDGSGQGCYVDNNILYAATGIDSSNDSSELLAYGSGTGNGLEIYDVSNPSDPIWLSTSKTNSRLDINTSDIWDVVVAGDKAYLSSMYNGIYIYDVSNPKTPKLDETVSVVADKASNYYKDFDLSKYIFPYDASKETHASVSHAILNNDELIFTTTNMGVYRCDLQITSNRDEIAPIEKDEYQFVKSNNNADADVSPLKNYDVQLFKSDAQVWTIEKMNEYYAIANGTKGIRLMDRDLKLVYEYKTVSPVRDIKISGDYIIASECEDGLAVYELSESGISFVARYKEDRYDSCFGDLILTPDGNYCLCEVAQRRYTIVDLRDKSNLVGIDPKTIAGTNDIGLMYYRSCVNGVIDGKYVAIGGSSYVDYYYSDNGELSFLKREENSLYSKSNGIVAMDEGVLQIAKNGYFVRSLDGKQSEKIKIKGITFEGKATTAGNLLVISNEVNGNIMIVDIADINNPQLIESFFVDGNPDVALIDGTDIVIPCRRYGILRISARE